jgi:hypothetical protein
MVLYQMSYTGSIEKIDKLQNLGLEKSDYAEFS